MSRPHWRPPPRERDAGRNRPAPLMMPVGTTGRDLRGERKVAGAGRPRRRVSPPLGRVHAAAPGAARAAR